MENNDKKKRWADIDDNEPFTIKDFPNLELVKTDKNGIRVPHHFRERKPDKKSCTQVGK
jgi:hypothetical protein